MAVISLPDAEMLRTPGNLLRHAYQSRSHARRRDSHFSAVPIACKMYFNTASEIEASFNRRFYDGDLFQSDHERGYMDQCSGY